MRLRQIIGVKVNKFTLECEMENGELFNYDMSFVLKEEGPMVTPLKDQSFFKKVFIEWGCVTWPNGYCIDGESIALNGKLLSKSAA